MRFFSLRSTSSGTSAIIHAIIDFMKIITCSSTMIRSKMLVRVQKGCLFMSQIVISDYSSMGMLSMSYKAPISPAAGFRTNIKMLKLTGTAMKEMNSVTESQLPMLFASSAMSRRSYFVICFSFRNICIKLVRKEKMGAIGNATAKRATKPI